MSVSEIKLLIGILVISLCFFTLTDPIEKLLAVVFMLVSATIYNGYSFFVDDDVDYYWITANVVLIVYFFLKYKGGAFSPKQEDD